MSPPRMVCIRRIRESPWTPCPCPDCSFQISDKYAKLLYAGAWSEPAKITIVGIDENMKVVTETIDG